MSYNPGSYGKNFNNNMLGKPTRAGHFYLAVANTGKGGLF